MCRHTTVINMQNISIMECTEGENAPYELEVSVNDCCVDQVDNCQLC